MKFQLALCTAAATLLAPAWAQQTGPSSSASAYLLPAGPHASTLTTTSVLTVGDMVGGYQMVGIPDGLGAFDNGDGTFTLVMNHELGGTDGATRAHGSVGAFVSKWVINKDTLAVISGADLIQSIYPWDSVNKVSSSTPATTAFTRFCTADLAAPTAYYNAATGLGSQARIFLNGEEGGTLGRAYAHVVTGADAGKSYELGLISTGTTAADVNAPENLLACPFAQDKTIVMIDNDGGGANVKNKVLIYVGTKTNTGTEADKAGLTNGVTKFIAVAGSSAEIVNTTTRATNIVSGTAFTLSSTAAGGTTFSRPEDGAWNPVNPKQYYFVTTDQLDKVADGVGAQVGRARLWRLTFADLSNPDAGGTIDLVLDGTEGGNMFDNVTISPKDGHVFLQEDTGNAEHNAKIWEYNPDTDALTLVMKHDVARFGDVVNGTVTPATLPFTQDEESSGIIDITSIMADSKLSTGAPDEKWVLFTCQAHYTLASPLMEGGQLIAAHRSTPEDAKAPVEVHLDVRGGKKMNTDKPVFRVKGVSSSTEGVVKVQYRLPGEKKFRTAKGTESWSFNAKLKPGKNKILVRVTSASGETEEKVVVVTRRK